MQTTIATLRKSSACVGVGSADGRNGDLNILGSFIAFASPMDPAWITAHAQPGEIPQTCTSSQTRMLASAFDKVTSKFFEEDVGLVVRLNDEL